MQSSNNVYQISKQPSQLARFWREFKRNIPAFFAFWAMLVLLTITLLAPWLAPFEPELQLGEIYLPPSWYSDGRVEYFLGTDDLGRDILSRLIAGSQLTLGNALFVTISAGVVGVLVGMLAGISKGMLASSLNHWLDALLSIPSLLLAIILVAFFGIGEMQTLFAIWLALVPQFIRSTYSAVSLEMNKEYILSARLDGANNFYLLYHAVVPNILATLTSTFARSLSSAILDIAALGFLGLSSAVTRPEWGKMLGEAIEFVFIAPWMAVLPCAVIMFCVLMINLLSDGITQAINVGTE